MIVDLVCVYARRNEKFQIIGSIFFASFDSIQSNIMKHAHAHNIIIWKLKIRKPKSPAQTANARDESTD